MLGLLSHLAFGTLLLPVGVAVGLGLDYILVARTLGRRVGLSWEAAVKHAPLHQLLKIVSHPSKGNPYRGNGSFLVLSDGSNAV